MASWKLDTSWKLESLALGAGSWTGWAFGELERKQRAGSQIFDKLEFIFIYIII